MGLQGVAERHQHRGPDHRPPHRGDAAEEGDDQRLGRGQDAKDAVRRHHQKNDRVEPAGRRGECAAEHDRAHFPAPGVDPGRLGRRLVLFDREQRHAEARPLDRERDQERQHQEADGDRDIGAVVAELHVASGCRALHRQRHLLVAEPFEDVEQRQRVGEHRQRKIMAAQAKGRPADDRAGGGPDQHAERDAEPGRDVEPHQSDGNGVGAEAEERGVAERDETAVAAQ